MARAFYSDFVTHCMRYYSRYPVPKDFRSEVDKANWWACKKSLASFPKKDRDILLAIYRKGDTISDNVYEVCRQNHIEQDRVWAMIYRLEKLIAKKRRII